jgi:hypothetical protein
MNDAVGDLHGDFERTLWALQLAGVLSKDGLYRWIGGTTVTNKQTGWSKAFSSSIKLKKQRLGLWSSPNSQTTSAAAAAAAAALIS